MQGNGTRNSVILRHVCVKNDWLYKGQNGSARNIRAKFKQSRFAGTACTLWVKETGSALM